MSQFHIRRVAVLGAGAPPTALHAEKNKFVARAKVKRLAGESIGRLAIPVPPPEEQERIVAVLDPGLAGGLGIFLSLFIFP